MSAINRAGLWFTIVGAAVVAGIVAHYEGEHSAPVSTVLLGSLALGVGFIALMYEPNPTSPTKHQ